jgi:hypothetical protein
MISSFLLEICSLSDKSRSTAEATRLGKLFVLMFSFMTSLAVWAKYFAGAAVALFITDKLLPTDNIPDKTNAVNIRACFVLQ